MLIQRQPAVARRATGGFTLVEMMVALTLGLLVVSAVLAFIFSLIRANSETVLSTRLNQELRATMSVVTGEVRRARGLRDPISYVGHGANANDFKAITISGGNDCIVYGYDYAATVPVPANYRPYRAIRLNNGTIELASGATRTAAECDDAGSALNSNAIEITRFSVTRDALNKRFVNVEITARLRKPPAYMKSTPAMAITTKTMRQTVSVRSNES